MVRKIKVWLYCIIVSLCANSTFGRCCHCPCWKNEENGKINDMNNPKYNLISNSYEEDGIEEVLYYKIVNKDDSKLQDYFNAGWYADRKNGVFQLKSTNKDDNNALKVIGKGNNWRIEYNGMNAFKEEWKYDSGKKNLDYC